ncbi:MAG: diguanylate cyclase [Candidatus Omnitrophica bacterium]|nr:diguanylate cyclase [Candidatus Omnitrophota bacterium]
MVLDPPRGLVKNTSILDSVKEVLSRFFFRFSFLLPPLVGCLLILGLNSFAIRSPFLDRAENLFFDAFLKYRPTIRTNPSIIFIEVSEDLIRSMPTLPVPWRYHAALIHILNEWGAKAILFDMLFPKPTQPLDVEALRQAIEKSGRVYLPVLVEYQQGEKVWQHSIPEFERAAKGIGHVNVLPDKDGVFRSIAPVLSHQNETYEHLGLLLARDFLEKEEVIQRKYLFSREGKEFFLINWAGKWVETFEHYSYLDVLKSFKAQTIGEKPLLSPETFREKICLIGVTLSGGGDIKSTPLEPTYPGVGTIANVINMVLTNQFIRPARAHEEVAALWVLSLLTMICIIPFRTLFSPIAIAVLSLLWILGSFLAFCKIGVWFATVHPLTVVFELSIFSSVYSKITTDRERTRFFQLATKDGLTGLYVMRHFHELMKKIIEYAWKTGKPLSLMLIDTDQFKEINDTYSHLAGDEVLKHVAQTILSCIRGESDEREGDIAARYGGDEFIVAILNMDAQEVAFKIAERLRKSIAEKPLKWHEREIPITISIGISALRKTDKNIEELIRRADQALYRAKGQGRNQVCLE